MVTRDYTKDLSQRKEYDEGLKSYMLKVYNLMAIALGISGIAALMVLAFEPLTQAMFNISPRGEFMGYTSLGMVIAFAPLAIMIFYSFGIKSMSTETAQITFWAYAALTGMSLSSLGFIYTGESIARTFFITSSVFAGMSIYGYTTKRDLTSAGSFLVMALIGLVVASLVNLAMQSSVLYFITSFAGVAIFMGLIAYDTQKIKAIYFQTGGGEGAQKAAINAALSLYLDLINLFIMLLRFFGNRRD